MPSEVLPEPPPAATQHSITNQRISFDSRTTGRYTAYIQAQHWADRDRWYLIGGWYENEVRRGEVNRR